MIEEIIQNYKLFEGISAIGTLAYAYLTYCLVQNTKDIHGDLSHAEENYYKMLDKTEALLKRHPNGAINTRGVETAEEEYNMLRHMLDEISELYHMANESLKIRMKKRFRTFISQNPSTFNLKDCTIHYWKLELNPKLNLFYKSSKISVQNN
jgi:hypothetical protein